VPISRLVTLTQLEAFVLVARLGSVKAAASTLGVTEPAVSGALAALRQQLGDPLVERNGSAMVLTPGGQALVPLASQMIALAAEADAAIRRAQGGPERLRVVATSTVAESVAPGLLAAFAGRPGAAGTVETSLGVATSEEMPAVLHERLADVALGHRLPVEQLVGLEAVPLFRYRMVFVTSPSHRLAAMESLHPKALAGQTWLVDPDGADEASPIRQMLDHVGVPEDKIRVFPSQAATWVAASEGQGIAPAVAHLVTQEISRRSLVALSVQGMPVSLLWYATTLASNRRSPAASALLRYLTTPDATHAMHAPLSGVPPSRFRPPVYVTLWS